MKGRACRRPGDPYPPRNLASFIPLRTGSSTRSQGEAAKPGVWGPHLPIALKLFALQQTLSIQRAIQLPPGGLYPQPEAPALQKAASAPSGVTNGITLSQEQWLKSQEWQDPWPRWDGFRSLQGRW